MERNKQLLFDLAAKRREEVALAKETIQREMERRERMKETLAARARVRRNSIGLDQDDGANNEIDSEEEEMKQTLLLKFKKKFSHLKAVDMDGKPIRTSAPADRRSVSTGKVSSELKDEDFGTLSSWGNVNWADIADRDGGVVDSSLCFDYKSPSTNKSSMRGFTSPGASEIDEVLEKSFLIEYSASEVPVPPEDLIEVMRAISSEGRDIPVGSAFKAARSRKNSFEASLDNVMMTKAVVDTAEIADGLKRGVRERQQKEKVVQYLQKLADEKKSKDEQQRAKERASKKRQQILSVRIFNESLERKLMALEDKYANGVPPEPAPKASTTKQLKITPELSDAIYNRLVAKQTKATEAAESLSKATVSVRDYAEWKKKLSIPADTRVFQISGWFPCVRDALLLRGWHHNKDFASPYFDLKWTNKTMDIEQETLQPWQLTNHFTKNVVITTKVGLLRSLCSLVWSADMRHEDIIPRAYDLSNDGELEEFVLDFKIQRAHCLLKQVYFKSTGLRSHPRCSDCAQHAASTEYAECEVCYPPPPSSEAIKVNKAVLSTACSTLQRHLRLGDVNYVDHNEDLASVTDVEWEVMSYDVFARHSLPPTPPESDLRPKDDTRNSTALELKKQRAYVKQEEVLRRCAASDIGVLVDVDASLLALVHGLLLQLRDKEASQAKMNGDFAAAKNIWIVKPAAKSRGRGICAFTDLPKLLRYVEAGTTISAQNMWVVQKYMENPLVIADRKFDLRQWVLVTDWNPLTIYFYDEFYARFSVEKYSTEDASMDNAFVHLVNNSIGKNSEQFGNTITAENGAAIEGYMMDFNMFSEYMKFKTGVEGFVRANIQSRMKEIVRNSLTCASDSVDHRKNSWELYGFDFMVDDAFETWLIEINSSPACDYSTKVTEVYVQKALVELLSVVLDLKEWEKGDKDTRGVKPTTGGWTCIHKGPFLDVPVSSFGADMGIKGSALKCPPKKVVPFLRSSSSVDLEDKATKDIDKELVDSITARSNREVPKPRLSLQERKDVNMLSTPPPCMTTLVPAETLKRASLTSGGDRALRVSPRASLTDSSDSENEEAGPGVVGSGGRKPQSEKAIVSSSKASNTYSHSVFVRGKGRPQQRSSSNAASIPIKMFTVEF